MKNENIDLGATIEEIRVLILEDLPSDADFAKKEVRSVIKNLEFKVVDTENDYVQALKIFKPDVIISDYLLPEFDGMSALKLRQKMCPMTSFVLLTGSINEETAVEVMKAGADDYVIKEHIKRLGPAMLGALDNKRIERERIENEIAFTISEDKYRNIFENAPDGIMQLDSNANIIECNQAECDMLGYDRDEIIGKHVTEFLSKDSEEISKKGFPILQKDGHSEAELTLVRKDGATTPIWRTVNTIYDKDGKFSGAVANSHDITERKQAENVLKENEDRYRQIYEFSPDSVIIHDMDMNILDVNNKAVKEFGYSKKEMLKMKVFDLHPKTELKHSEQVLDTMNKKEMLTVETKFVRKDGSVFLVEATPCKYMLGRKTIIHVVIRDITERKQAGELVSGLAHKLRNPLSVISSTTQYVLDDLEVSGEYKEAFEVIKRNADLAGHRIYELLHFAGSKQMNIKATSLFGTFEKVHKMIESDFYQHGVCIIKENMDSDIVSFYDEESIMEVLMNVYLNAFQSLKEGCFIRTNLSSSDDYAIVKIEDNGCGISEENLSKVFDPFFSTKEKGTGLGLTVCHSILEKQHGSITVESILSKGTIVTITLPKAQNARK